MAIFLLFTFYAAMAIAALIVELLFGVTGLIPHERHAQVVEPAIAWNYTAGLNIAFLALAAALAWRFFRTAGIDMLRMMNAPARSGQHHAHS
jgi:hypothetical protein